MLKGSEILPFKLNQNMAALFPSSCKKSDIVFLLELDYLVLGVPQVFFRLDQLFGDGRAHGLTLGFL